MASIILDWLRKKNKRNFFYPELEKKVVPENVEEPDVESFSEKLISPFKNIFERPSRRYKPPEPENQLLLVSSPKKNHQIDSIEKDSQEVDHSKIPTTSEAAAELLKQLKMQPELVEENELFKQVIHPVSPQNKRKREVVELQLHEMQIPDPTKFIRLKDEFTRSYKAFPVTKDANLYSFSNQRIKDTFIKPKVDPEDNDDDSGTTAEQAKIVRKRIKKGLLEAVKELNLETEKDLSVEARMEKMKKRFEESKLERATLVEE